MFKQFFDWKSTTFKGTMLALVWLILTMTGMADPTNFPKWALDGLKILSLGLILFGWNNIALAEFESMKSKFVTWIATSPGVGFLFQLVNLFLDNMPKFSLGEDLQAIFTAISYFLIAMGVRKMLAGATMNKAPIAAENKEKYTMLARSNPYSGVDF